MSGERGVKGVNEGCSAKEVPSVFFIARSPRGGEHAECMYSFLQNLREEWVDLDDVQGIRHGGPGVSRSVLDSS